ncbi:MAG: hypothetical protein P8K79_04720 [Mariniblastus sp.]|nr:hypothetical protein [Mariniblastus sp.]
MVVFSVLVGWEAGGALAHSLGNTDFCDFTDILLKLLKATILDWEL